MNIILIIPLADKYSWVGHVFKNWFEEADNLLQVACKLLHLFISQLWNFEAYLIPEILTLQQHHLHCGKGEEIGLILMATWQWLWRWVNFGPYVKMIMYTLSGMYVTNFLPATVERSLQMSLVYGVGHWVFFPQWWTHFSVCLFPCLCHRIDLLAGSLWSQDFFFFFHIVY